MPRANPSGTLTTSDDSLSAFCTELGITPSVEPSSRKGRKESPDIQINTQLL